MQRDKLIKVRFRVILGGYRLSPRGLNTHDVFLLLWWEGHHFCLIQLPFTSLGRQ